VAASQPAGTLAGLATLGRMVVLHRPKPIGRAVLAAAEEALAPAGCGLLEITSNMRFAAAHRFYNHLGYEQTSMRFAKVLAPVS
jgi:GNAT superfamily N-acetyltransferase